MIAFQVLILGLRDKPMNGMEVVWRLPARARQTFQNNVDKESEYAGLADIDHHDLLLVSSLHDRGLARRTQDDRSRFQLTEAGENLCEDLLVRYDNGEFPEFEEIIAAHYVESEHDFPAQSL